MADNKLQIFFSPIHFNRRFKSVDDVKAYIQPHLKKKNVEFVIEKDNKDELIEILLSMGCKNPKLKVFKRESREEVIKRVRKIVPKGLVPSKVIDAALRRINQKTNNF